MNLEVVYDNGVVETCLNAAYIVIKATDVLITSDEDGNMVIQHRRPE